LCRGECHGGSGGQLVHRPQKFWVCHDTVILPFYVTVSRGLLADHARGGATPRGAATLPVMRPAQGPAWGNPGQTADRGASARPRVVIIRRVGVFLPRSERSGRVRPLRTSPLAMLVLAGGLCPGCAAVGYTVPVTSPVPGGDVVYVANSSGDIRTTSAALAQAVEEQRAPLQVETFVW